MMVRTRWRPMVMGLLLAAAVIVSGSASQASAKDVGSERAGPATSEASTQARVISPQAGWIFRAYLWNGANTCPSGRFCLWLHINYQSSEGWQGVQYSPPTSECAVLNWRHTKFENHMYSFVNNTGGYVSFYNLSADGRTYLKIYRARPGERQADFRVAAGTRADALSWDPRNICGILA